MLNLTPVAVGKVKEILDTQDPRPQGLRISVVGGGCSGFSYSMAFENAPGMLDKQYDYEGLKVYVDQASASPFMYVSLVSDGSMSETALADYAAGSVLPMLPNLRMHAVPSA